MFYEHISNQLYEFLLRRRRNARVVVNKNQTGMRQRSQYVFGKFSGIHKRSVTQWT